MTGKLRPLVRCAPEEIRGKFEREARNTLRALRRAARLSQARFALRIECASTSIENYESGRSRVPAWVLLAAEDLALGRTGT